MRLKVQVRFPKNEYFKNVIFKFFFRSISYNILVVTEKIYSFQNFENHGFTSLIILQLQQEGNNTTKWGIGIGKQKANFYLSNNYLDDFYTLRDQLGFLKTQLKLYFNCKSYLPCLISSSSSQINTPISNNNPYNILHVVFFSFYSTILFSKGSKMERQQADFLCYPCNHTLYRIDYDSGRELSFNNVNLCESNIGLIFQLVFCNNER